jgi:hypothetical protein
MSAWASACSGAGTAEAARLSLSDALPARVGHACANARAPYEECVVRWLLIADDRVDPEEIKLSPENIAIALQSPWESLTTTDQVRSRGLELDGHSPHHRRAIAQALRGLPNGPYEQR